MRTWLKNNPVRAVLVLFFVAALPVLAMRDFTPDNELRYLSIADEALAGGHFFILTNHGIPYADKPPLYLWLVMLLRVLLGRHSMLALGMLSFLPACGIILVMDRWVRSGAESALTASERAAAAAMLAGTGIFAGMACFLRMDMLMCFFIVLALFQFDRGRPWAFALATFFALFSKGPVGLLVPLLGAALQCGVRRDGKAAARMLGWRFWLVLAAGCACWFGGVLLEGGKDYLRSMLVDQTFGRAVGSSDHNGPFWLYFALLWAVLAPYCFVNVPTAAGALRSRGTEGFLARTALLTLLMLSCFGSKLLIYLAPLMPLAVYTVPAEVRRRGWTPLRAWGLRVPAILFILIGLAAIAVPLGLHRIPLLAEFDFLRSPLVACCGIAPLAGGIFALRVAGRGWEQATLRLAGATAAFLFFAGLLVPQINPYTGLGDICSQVPAGAQVYTLRVRRTENIDVYLGYGPARAYEKDYDAFLEDIPAEGVLLVKDTALRERADLSGFLSEKKEIGRSGPFLLYKL